MKKYCVNYKIGGVGHFENFKDRSEAERLFESIIKRVGAEYADVVMKPNWFSPIGAVLRMWIANSGEADL